MLFIYGTLAMGGIETFFVRMAKERNKLGLTTSILLFSKPEDSDVILLNQMRIYAKVYFYDDLFISPKYLSKRLPLIAPIKRSALKVLLEGVEQVHVYHGIHALLGYRLTKALNINVPITVGFYHYLRYLWGGENVALHEKINRRFIFNYLPKPNLLLFSDGTRQLYEKHKNIDLLDASIFRLGVVDKKDVPISGIVRKPLRIVAIGRLVEFKTYNLYMLDVIKGLLDKGILVEFDIYGDGPLKQQIQQKIKAAGLEDKITLKGTLDYSKFDETVANYDLFIGSGTAIIQAAALGIVSIVGIENTLEPKTYGYFCHTYQHEYNLKGLDLPLISVEKLIVSFTALNEDERLKLRQLHLNCINTFTNEYCQKLMEKLRYIPMPLTTFRYNPWVYSFSRIFDTLSLKLNKNHPFLKRHTDFTGE